MQSPVDLPTIEQSIRHASIIRPPGQLNQLRIRSIFPVSSHRSFGRIQANGVGSRCGALDGSTRARTFCLQSRIESHQLDGRGERNAVDPDRWIVTGNPEMIIESIFNWIEIELKLNWNWIQSSELKGIKVLRSRKNPAEDRMGGGEENPDREFRHTSAFRIPQSRCRSYKSDKNPRILTESSSKSLNPDRVSRQDREILTRIAGFRQRSRNPDKDRRGAGESQSGIPARILKSWQGSIHRRTSISCQILAILAGSLLISQNLGSQES